MTVLDELNSDDLAETCLAVGTSDALIVILKRRAEVLSVRSAWKSGSLQEADVRDFVSTLSASFIRGRRFPGDVALCGLAVALASLPGDFIYSFLNELGSTHTIELPMSPRVAVMMLRERNRLLTETTAKRYCLRAPMPRHPGKAREASATTVPRVGYTSTHFRLAA